MTPHVRTRTSCDSEYSRTRLRATCQTRQHIGRGVVTGRNTFYAHACRDIQTVAAIRAAGNSRRQETSRQIVYHLNPWITLKTSEESFRVSW